MANAPATPCSADFPVGCVACYARISHDRHEGLGVDRQLDRCLSMVRLLDFAEPVVQFVDNDCGASRFATKQRPELQRLREWIASGTVRRLVFWDIDRMFRQPIELEQLFLLVDAAKDEHRVRLYNANDELEMLLNSAGRKQLRYRVADAAAETDRASERLIVQRRQARARGAAHGGKRPFGYRREWTTDAEGRTMPTLAVVPEEAELIREAARLILQGVSANGVGRLWADRGVRAPNGEEWHPSTITRVLRSPRIAGLVPHRGEEAGTASWEAILPPDTWQQLRIVLSGRYRPQGAPRRTLLTGVVVCGATVTTAEGEERMCGATLVGYHRQDGVVQRRCMKGPGRAGCGRVGVVERYLVSAVEEATFLHVDQLDFQAMLREVRADDGTLAVARELESAKAQLEEVKTLTVSGAYSPQDGADMLRGLHDRVEALRATLARSLTTSPLEPYAGRPGALRAAWPGLLTDQRRTLILATFGRIAILPTLRRNGPVFDPARVVFAPRFTS